MKNKEINTLSDPRIIFYDIVTLTILGIEKDIYKYSKFCKHIKLEYCILLLAYTLIDIKTNKINKKQNKEIKVEEDKLVRLNSQLMLCIYEISFMAHQSPSHKSLCRVQREIQCDQASRESLASHQPGQPNQ